MQFSQTEYSILNLHQGVDFEIFFKLSDIDDSIDITEKEIKVQFRKNYESKNFWEFHVTKSEDGFTIFLSKDKSKDIRAGYYNYSVVMSDYYGSDIYYQGAVNVIPTYLR